MEFETAGTASTKRGPPACLTSPPLKRASIGHVLVRIDDHSSDVNSSAISSHFASFFHARTDANALQTAGWQDGHRKVLMTVLQHHLLLFLS